MWADIWGILNTVTMGSLLWLGIIFLLAVIGEIGMPATSPVLESLLIFTGFELAHGAYIVDVVPFLGITLAGRLCGSISAYWLSFRLGNTIIEKFGRRIRITRERLEQVTRKLGAFALPAIITARFTPGFSVISSVASGTSKIGYRRFLTAVTLHVLIWEAIFLTFGVLGGRVSKFFDPQQYLVLIIVWIVIAITLGAAAGHFAFRRAKNAK